MPGVNSGIFFAVSGRLKFYGLMKTLFLLSLSNLFMTFAWYGHLKFFNELPLWKTILISWGIALFEYILMVPANRIGFSEEGFSGFQLKILQEIITITIFIGFASLILKEKMKWNHAVSFFLILLAVVFAFYDKK
ncbi:PF04342 family protein [Leptospira broomii serovar Hurstbridge str. 5399]|uniref:PF04342 family protein n=2 Tax=Leptospira broomii TaxID=301541 RepID=T0GKK5_9LEPT|nr:PF04342 family protein [Leptospira broomii serovar Hurstbridge str. 5399]